jgi:hypothetical protein
MAPAWDPVTCQLIVDKRSAWATVKKRIGCKSAAVKRRLYVCCSYNETVIITVLISVARI